ncbi:hypothetical protein [Stenotrophomonas sp. YIM B06876]|uniref:hypothetical protein n=1 Tax=Stenotrophomonas sp. YIM B06876 TaxID=3060211 RepID=UPI0027398004|nr:hypothetical protein [Stenotrophomonas sp. YIM B06876]
MPSTHHVAAACSAAFLAVVMQTAIAAPPDTVLYRVPLPAYNEMDKDKNGVVTLPEIDVYPPEIAARLRQCDTNKDLKLSREEYDRCEMAAHHPAKK